MRSSIAVMKAASVLPEPVGAAISTLRLALIAGQACVCVAVGARKLRSNQAATAGWNNADGLITRNAQAQLASHVPHWGTNKPGYCDCCSAYGDGSTLVKDHLTRGKRRFGGNLRPLRLVRPQIGLRNRRRALSRGMPDHPAWKIRFLNFGARGRGQGRG